jgi:phosphate-selective porin
MMRPLGAASLLAALLAAGPAAAQTETGWTFDGRSLRNKQHDFRLDLVGYSQFDFRAFPDWKVAADTSGNLHHASTELPRRLRLGIEGRWKKLAWEVQGDPQDTTEHLKNAYLELRLAKALRIRGGNFKVPVSREWTTSASKTDFVERSMLADIIAPGRDVGGMAYGELGDTLEYHVGVFAGDGRTNQSRAETTTAGRVVVTPIKHLEIGSSYSQGDVRADPESETVPPLPRGVAGRGPSGFRFYVVHHVNGTRRRIGFDSAVRLAGLTLKGEWLRQQEERRGQGAVFDDLPDEVGTGWAVSAVWTSKKKKSAPAEEESEVTQGWYKGPVEVAARYESLRFDDNGPSGGFSGVGNRSRNIRPAADRVITGGLSWWIGKWARVMGNVNLERFEDPLVTPEPGRRGNYVTLLGRLQLQIP